VTVPRLVSTATYGRGRRVRSNQRQVAAIDLIATSPSNAGVDPVIFFNDLILLLAININHQKALSRLSLLLWYAECSGTRMTMEK